MPTVTGTDISTDGNWAAVTTTGGIYYVPLTLDSAMDWIAKIAISAR